MDTQLDEFASRGKIERYMASCAGKVQYPTAAAAEQAADFVLRRKIKHLPAGKIDDFIGELYTYKCIFCPWFHRGHG